MMFVVHTSSLSDFELQVCMYFILECWCELFGMATRPFIISWNIERQCLCFLSLWFSTNLGHYTCDAVDLIVVIK